MEPDELKELEELELEEPEDFNETPSLEDANPADID